MKRLSFFGAIAIFALSVLFLASCEDPNNPTGGGGGGTNANPPILDLVGANEGFTTSDVTVEPGATVKIKINAIKGDNLMKNVRFTEDGSLVNDFANRLKINGAGASSSNVLIVNEAEKTSLTWEIEYTAPTEQKATIFSVQVTDTANNSDKESITITTQVTTVLSLNLTENAPYTWTDITSPESSLVKIQLTAVKGAYDLSTLAVYENNQLIADTTRLRIGEVAKQFSANPLPLAGNMASGFVSEMWVKTHTGQGVSKDYKFEVKDANGAAVSVGFKITTPAPNPDVTTLTGVLLNAAGPAGTGGLDLETGTGTGSNATTADIKDLGIDQSLPNAQNWIQKIAPVGSTILTKAPSASEFPTSFDDIQYKSEIEAAYNASTQIETSNVVNIGDVFLVNNGTNKFIIKCTNINVTSDNNNDSYTFSVKY